MNGDHKPMANGLPFEHNLRCSDLYINRVSMVCSRVALKEDRIFLSNVAFDRNCQSRVNMTLPYVELSKIQFYIDEDLELLAIKPTMDSACKFLDWMNKPRLRIVPENFITIRVKNFTEDMILQVKSKCQTTFPNLKIIEINYVYANKFIESNWETQATDNTRATPHPVANTSQAIVTLDIDDDDDQEEQNIKAETSAVSSPPVKLLNQVIYRTENKINILGRDLNCLRGGEYLNDNIMNFYLDYIKNSTGLPSETLNRFYLFDVFFGTRLTNNKSVKAFENKYHTVIKRWLKEVDIFSKDFLIIPIVKDNHWMMAIICYVAKVFEKVCSQDKIQPTIILMDSLYAGEYSRLERSALNNLKIYLFEYVLLECRERRGVSFTIKDLADIFHVFSPRLPNQTNHYDCGLFVIEYFEQFIKSPDVIFDKVVQQQPLTRWFDKALLEATKRSKIQQIILNLIPPEVARQLEQELNELNLKAFEKEKPKNDSMQG